MTKKFFDIVPPEGAETKSSFPVKKKESAPGEDRKRKGIFRRNFIRVPRGRAKKFLLKVCFPCLIVLILIIVLNISFFSKSEIEIWPKTRTLTLTKTVIVSLDQKQLEMVSENEGIIPGEIFEDQKSGSQDFPASGRILKEEKAKGVIRVYNAYSTSLQGLLVNTRFVSTDGKLFRSVRKETIPGGTYEKGKLVPGTADIEVRAAEAGEDYNIEPSIFSIPGFAGTSKYTAYYGKSFSPMSGGFKGEVAQVTQEDLDKARSILVQKLEKESREFLKSALPSNFVLLEETLFQEAAEENYSAETGAEANSFNFQVKVKSAGLTFKEQDMRSLAETFIKADIAEDERFQGESLEINYSLIEREEEGSKAVLNLKIEVKIYSDIDLAELKKVLLGKSFKEVKIFLEDQPQVDRIEIIPGLFWRKRVPENMNKVELKLNLD